MRGCGKSTLTRSLAEQHSRRIVFDIVQEWNGKFYYVNSVDKFMSVWREVFCLEEFTIVIRYEFGMSPEQITASQTKICELIYRTGRDTRLHTCLIFEEAHFYFPNHKMHPINLHLLTTGRHARISMVVNTQRPAQLSKTLLSQSSAIYVGKLYEKNDIDYLRDCMGDVANRAKELPNFEFIFFPVGDSKNISIIALNA